MSKNIFTKDQQKAIENFLQESGFEIWNAGCTYRMRADFSDDGFAVCSYHDPLHPIKTYKTLNGALSFLQKQDEQ